MAEGVACLNQQVVGIDLWLRPDRSPSLDPTSTSRVSMACERGLHLRRAVEAEVIPRLRSGHHGGQAVPADPPAARMLPNSEVRRFAHLLLSHDENAAVLAFLAEARLHDRSFELLYLDLFEPAARYIGELWCEDACSFLDVTLAVGTLQRLLQTFGPEFHKTARPADGARFVLLAPMPGDQHTFGLSMVAEFFRRGGWNVWSAPFATLDDLGQRVHSTWLSMVGLSASCVDRLDELAAAISVIRRESMNASIGVLVGGPAFVNRPDLVAEVGADALGGNAVQALVRAEGLLSRMPGP